MRIALHQHPRAQVAEGFGVQAAQRGEHIGVTAAEALGGRGLGADAGLYAPGQRIVALESTLQLHHRQHQPWQLLVAQLVVEIVPEQRQPRLQRIAAAEHRRRRRRIDPENRIHRGAQHGPVGLPGIGDQADLRQCLGQARQGQRTVLEWMRRADWGYVTHAVWTFKRCSSGASVAAITAPPRHSSAL